MANTTKTTKTTTSRFTVRKKIAAASLALGAGLIGTGFAAGVIDLNPAEQSGFGTGNAGVGFGNEVGQVDITATLEINRPAEARLTTSSSDSPFQSTQADYYTISGFEEIAAEHPGATYKVATKASSSPWRVEEALTGTVTADTVVQVPLKNPNGDVIDIAVAIEK